MITLFGKYLVSNGLTSLNACIHFLFSWYFYLIDFHLVTYKNISFISEQTTSSAFLLLVSSPFNVNDKVGLCTFKSKGLEINRFYFCVWRLSMQGNVLFWKHWFNVSIFNVLIPTLCWCFNVPLKMIFEQFFFLNTQCWALKSSKYYNQTIYELQLSIFSKHNDVFSLDHQVLSCSLQVQNLALWLFLP